MMTGCLQSPVRGNALTFVEYHKIPVLYWCTKLSADSQSVRQVASQKPTTNAHSTIHLMGYRVMGYTYITMMWTD